MDELDTRWRAEGEVGLQQGRTLEEEVGVEVGLWSTGPKEEPLVDCYNGARTGAWEVQLVGATPVGEELKAELACDGPGAEAVRRRAGTPNGGGGGAGAVAGVEDGIGSCGLREADATSAAGDTEVEHGPDQPSHSCRPLARPNATRWKEEQQVGQVARG